MKNKIIEECKKYGYLLDYEEDDYLHFRNPTVREELQIFNVIIMEELELVSMAVIIDLGSWNEALESDLNNEKDIMKNIESWLSEKNLKSIEEWLDN